MRRPAASPQHVGYMTGHAYETPSRSPCENGLGAAGPAAEEPAHVSHEVVDRAAAVVTGHLVVEIESQALDVVGLGRVGGKEIASPVSPTDRDRIATSGTDSPFFLFEH